MTTLQGIRKAAVLLSSLPANEAATVLGKLDKHDVEAVSIEIAKMGALSQDEHTQIVKEFAESNPSVFGQLGGFDVAQNLLEMALGQDAAGAVDNVRQSIQALPFGFVKRVDPQNLLSYVIDEHPQTIALILSHLPPGYGAEIIAGLPADRQAGVIRRIANMGQTNPEVIQEVEAALERRIEGIMSQQFENAGGVESVAEILNVTDRSTERALMETLSEEDPELVEEIRRRMFVFEDIANLGDKDVQEVLKNVETSQWSMGLKGASEELKTKVMGNMSQRAAAMLQEEIDFLGAVKSSEVEKVQQQVVDIVRRLEDAGIISVRSDDSADEMIE